MAEKRTLDENDDSAETSDTPPHLQTNDQKGAGPIAEPGGGASETDDPRGPGNIGRA